MRTPAAVFFDGGMVQQVMMACGNPKMLYLVRALEQMFGLDFVRKEWHQGTEDGRPNDFHRAIVCPENGHIVPKIRGMKEQSGRLPKGQGRATVRVEKGVDVALAVAILDRGHQYQPYSVVLVLTGDADLLAAMESCERRVVVCSADKGLAHELRPYIRVVEDRAVTLEQVVMRAIELQTACGSLLGPPKPKRPDRFKCFAGRQCNKLSDPDHLRQFHHPCLEYGACPHIKDEAHTREWGHPCPSGAECTNTTMAHLRDMEHPREGRVLCTEAGCGKRTHWHMCKWGRKCENRHPDHLAAYAHPCPFRGGCLSMLDPEWSHQHMRDYVHEERYLLRKMAGCVDTN